MNQNEFNGAEFSGAASSNVITRVATAVAVAIVTGYKTVYRGLSATVDNTSTITAILRNQYNGLITLATTISQSVSITATSLLSRAAKAVVSASSSVTATLFKIRALAAAVAGNAVEIYGFLQNQYNGILEASALLAQEVQVQASAIKLLLSSTVIEAQSTVSAALIRFARVATAITYSTNITAILRNQFNNLVMMATNVVHTTTIIAKMVRFAAFKAVLTYSTSVTARLFRRMKAAAVVSAQYTIVGKLYAIRKANAVASATYNVIANLAAVVPVKSIIQAAYEVAARAFAQYKGKSVVSQSTTVVANLESSVFAPAAPENTFYVPADDMTYDVEES